MGRVSDAKQRLMEAVAELIFTGSYGSTTIDQICDKAGVKKGSFYYFFESKAQLAEEAIQSEWEAYRPVLDQMFSATLPPLERIRRFCEHSYEEQADLKAKYGRVLGCPLCTLGTEVSTQEDGLRRKVDEIMGQWRKYLESTIRDAQAAGVVSGTDPAAKARALYAYHEGLLTQARIQNNLDILRELAAGTFEILGVRQPEASAI